MLRDKVYTMIYVYQWMFCPNTSNTGDWCSIHSDKQHFWWDIVLCPTVIFHTDVQINQIQNNGIHDFDLHALR